jgi:hypothetical protein
MTESHNIGFHSLTHSLTHSPDCKKMLLVKARSASAKTGRQSSGSLWQGVPNCLTRRRMTASNDTLAVGK